MNDGENMVASDIVRFVEADDEQITWKEIAAEYHPELCNGDSGLAYMNAWLEVLGRKIGS
jgi:hypothetical protein